MKANKYDDSAFFDKYSRMERSKRGLEGAGDYPIIIDWRKNDGFE